MVLAGVRSEKHFHILHPDYERMSDSEKWKALDDQMFLFNHDDEVNKEYYKLRGEARYVRGEEPDPQECMRQAVENVKEREEQSKQENNQQLSTEENNQEQSTDDNDER